MNSSQVLHRVTSPISALKMSERNSDETLATWKKSPGAKPEKNSSSQSAGKTSSLTGILKFMDNKYCEQKGKIDNFLMSFDRISSNTFRQKLLSAILYITKLSNQTIAISGMIPTTIIFYS
jgi:hypothetical protein